MTDEDRRALLALAAQAVAAALQILAAYVAGTIDRKVAAGLVAGVIGRANESATILADLSMSRQLSSAAGEDVPPLGIVRPEHEGVRLERAADIVLSRVEEKAPPEPDADPEVPEPSSEVETNTRPPTRPATSAPPTRPAQRSPAPRPEPSTIRPTPSSAPAEVEETEIEEPEKIEGVGSVERLAHSEPLAAAAETVEEIVQRSPLVVAYRREVSENACQRCIDWAEGGRRIPAKRPFKRHHGCTCQQIPIIKKVEGK
jgi:hypothetical protein